MRGAARARSLPALCAAAGIALLGLLAPSAAVAQCAGGGNCLTAGDVDRVLSQAVQEAAARGMPATIAVVDRVGNVLGVYAMNGAAQTVTLTTGRGVPLGNGLEQLPLGPALLPGVNGSALGAIAKAITGAYLSSAGNAFTTRTASQIVQEFFNPGERGQASGPLFGVQFSQLPCSDLARAGAAIGTGPRRSPLGLAADPGGLPLYKNGQNVGGVGVIADGVYGIDRVLMDYDRNVDELIAVAAQTGYAPPTAILAHRIAVDGKLLRYSDVDARHLASNPGAASGSPSGGSFLNVPGYFTVGASRAGTEFGEVASGIRPDRGDDYPEVQAFVLDDGLGNNRFSPRDSIAPLPGGGGLTQAEVRRLITEALRIAFRGRAQIRKPLGSYIQVTVSVVDNESNILGIARTPDAPIFGTDVSLQKARSALFFSRTTTAAELAANGSNQTVGGAIPVPALATYVTAAQQFLGPDALANGIAFADRSIGNLSRPFFPDGIPKKPNGPFSKPIEIWSPFNTGLQLDLVLADIVERLDGSLLPDPAAGCVAGGTNVTALTTNPPALPRSGAGPTRLANGLQIFPGSVPIFRNGTLIGAIGVSGDGIDQDDMVSFLGLHNGGVALGTGVGHAPVSRRANTLAPRDINLRYVNCPFAPFLDSRDQNVCGGK